MNWLNVLRARAVLLALAALALALAPATGRAAASEAWLDDMPPVPTVIEVVRRVVEEDIRQNPKLAENADWLPTRMMGTLVLMRWVMEFQVEVHGALSPEGTKRMRKMADEYMQAEYAIGLGTARRKGFISQECQRNGPNRADFKTFATADDCHRHLTHKLLGFVYAAFKWRNIVFPLLFCDRATYYLALMQDHILTLPSPERSPAVVGVLPEGGDLLGAAYCKPYGADADGDGVCDGWMLPAAANARTDNCAPLIMDKVRMAAGSGLIVTFARQSGKAGMSARFKVRRAADANADVQSLPLPLWEGNATLAAGTTPDSPLQVLLMPGTDFRPDPSKPDPEAANPWLVVELVSDGKAASVRCGRPLAVDTRPAVEPRDGIRLFGPYSTELRAIFPVGLTALGLTGKPGESGFLLLQRAGPTPPFVYYTTMPVSAGMAAGTGKQPLFQPDDFRASIRNAFKDSCEEMSRFTLKGTVHTHPDEWIEVPSFDNFSMLDFNQAIGMSRHPNSDFGGGVVLAHATDPSIYLIAMGPLHILRFTAQPAYAVFEDKELDYASWNSLTSKLYERYVGEQKKIGAYPQSIKN